MEEKLPIFTRWEGGEVLQVPENQEPLGPSSVVMEKFWEALGVSPYMKGEGDIIKKFEDGEYWVERCSRDKSQERRSLDSPGISPT